MLIHFCSILYYFYQSNKCRNAPDSRYVTVLLYHWLPIYVLSAITKPSLPFWSGLQISWSLISYSKKEKGKRLRGNTVKRCVTIKFQQMSINLYRVLITKKKMSQNYDLVSCRNSQDVQQVLSYPSWILQTVSHYIN